MAAFQPVLDIFEDLVADLDSFLDAARIRRDPSLVSQPADERAVAAYGRFVGAWMSTAKADERVERFERALHQSSPL